MEAVTPGVAFDLSVNRESNAFMGSILEADVSSRLDFTLRKTARTRTSRAAQEPNRNHHRRRSGPSTRP